MASPSSLRRVGFTFGAQIYNQVVNLGVQIALVPVFLHVWGAERYGAWLLLSAIPTYLTFSDFGFTLSAKNEMTIKAARGDSEGAIVTYQSVFMLLNVVVAGVICLAGLALLNIRLGSFFALGDTSETQAKLVLFLLCADVVLYQYFLLFSGGVRAAGRPAAETALSATARLCGGLLTASTVFLGGGIIAVAALTLVKSLVFIAVIFLWLRNIAPWLRLGWSQASRAEVDRLFHPSVSFMSQTVAQALVISGPVIVLGMATRPLDVVIFSTCRTLARLGTTATNMIGAAIMPEYSRLFGLGNLQLFRRLIILHFAAALAISIIYLGGLSVFGGWIIFVWTKGKVYLEQPFFALLLFSVVFEMLWTTLFIPLAAINRHVVTAHAYGVLAFIAVICGYFLAASYGLTGVVAPLLIINVMMLIIVMVQLYQRSPNKTSRLNG
jgi:O-antigen/teichoic acid export membrane protein